MSTSSPRKLPFRRIPFTVLDVDTSLFWARSVAEEPAEKLPLLGSSNTTEARLVLLLASFDMAESETEPIFSPIEFTERLDSVLCMLLFCIANFRKDDALGDSLLDFLRVPLGPELVSSTEELLGRAVFDKPSSPVCIPLPIQEALPLPVADMGFL